MNLNLEANELGLPLEPLPTTVQDGLLQASAVSKEVYGEEAIQTSNTGHGDETAVQSSNLFDDASKDTNGNGNLTHSPVIIAEDDDKACINDVNVGDGSLELKDEASSLILEGMPIPPFLDPPHEIQLTQPMPADVPLTQLQPESISDAVEEEKEEKEEKDNAAFDDMVVFPDGIISLDDDADENMKPSFANVSHQTVHAEPSDPAASQRIESSQGDDSGPEGFKGPSMVIGSEAMEESNALTESAAKEAMEGHMKQEEERTDQIGEPASVDMSVEKLPIESEASLDSKVVVEEAPLPPGSLQEGQINDIAMTEVEFEALTGRKVLKTFEDEDYLGEVISYDTEMKWYKVVYEDGDEEDLEKDELFAVLLPIGSTLKSSHSGNDLEDAKERKPKKLKKTSTKTTPKQKSSVGSKKIGTPTALKKGSQSGVKKGFKSSSKKVKSPGVKRAETKDGSNKGNRGKAVKSPSIARRKSLTPKKANKKKQMSVNQEVKKSSSKKPGSRQSEDEKSTKQPLKGAALKRKRALEEENVPPSKHLKVGSSSKEFGTQSESKPKNLVPDKEGASLIGTLVKKKFDGKYFDGEVVSYNKKNGYYKVQYEDGDKEDLEWEELEPILMNDDKVHSKGRASIKQER